MLHRIDSDSGDYGDIDYTYDASGNRLTKVVNSITDQTLTYTTNSNRLATHSGNTVTLDSAGNMTSDIEEGLSFVYDDHNRMVEAYVSSTLEATYFYNGHSERVKKVEATGSQLTTIFHYGLGGQLLGETVYDNLGAKIGERDYLSLDDLPVAQSERTFAGSTITSDVFVYLHADQLNTPRLATNSSGTVVWLWVSDAFGVGDANLDPDADMNEVSVRLRFPGQYLDDETGLHYNYFRDYDPTIGRYEESDPIGQDGGLNTFAYTLENPVIGSDPTGLFTYNKPPPATVPVTRYMAQQVTCVERCMGLSLVITGGQEQFRPDGGLYHSRNSLHYSGHAVDFGLASNPTLARRKTQFFCCALRCGLSYGGEEDPPHFHLQDRAGNGYDSPIAISRNVCRGCRAP